MKKARKLFIVFCISTTFLCGCEKKDPSPEPLTRVVTQVDISGQHAHTLIRRHYTDPDKMEYVLLYLRLLKSKGKPEQDPEQLDHAVFEITVHLSDGSKRLYKQKSHRYFSRDSRPWELIDPAQASGLYRLMEKVPSDPEISPM